MERTQRRSNLLLALLTAVGLVAGYFVALEPSPAVAACSNNTVNGTSQDDFIVGTVDKSSTIDARGGNDRVLARNCGDDVYGGAAADNLQGEAGNDHIHGEDAGDRPTNCGLYACGGLGGGVDNDRIYGEHGNDLLDDDDGQGDQDDLFGGQDNDDHESLDSDGQDNINGGPPSGPDETDQCSRKDNGDSASDCYIIS